MRQDLVDVNSTLYSKKLSTDSTNIPTKVSNSDGLRVCVSKHALLSAPLLCSHAYCRSRQTQWRICALHSVALVGVRMCNRLYFAKLRCTRIDEVLLPHPPCVHCLPLEPFKKITPRMRAIISNDQLRSRQKK